MSIISLLPVMSISLGSLSTVKNGKKELINYYGVFCSATKDKVYFLNGVEDIMIPRLVDLVKQPSLKLGSQTFDIELPATVLKTLFEFFAQPMTQIDGISLFDLYTQGFVSDQSLGTSMLSCIMPYLTAKDIDIETVDSDKLIKLANIVKSGDQGFLQKTSLGEQIKGYLNGLKPSQSKQDRGIDNQDRKDLKTFDQGIETPKPETTKDPDPVDVKSETIKDPIETPKPETKDQKDLPLNSLNVSGLKARAKSYGLKGYSKLSRKALYDLVLDYETTPKPETETQA
jgi:hypothetical protein